MILKPDDELWTYLGIGDGNHCPLYSRCNFRQTGGWCVEDNFEHINLRKRQAHELSDEEMARLNYNLGFSSHCKVVQLLESLAYNFLKKGKVNCIPVPTNLAMLAAEPNSIEVRLVPLQVTHGGLWQSGKTWIIHLNSNDSPSRRRFTLFHEVFHIMAHQKTTPVFSSTQSDGGMFNEWMADHFAAYVLAPPFLIDKEWQSSKDILKMIKRFDVNFGVMLVMLKRSGLVAMCTMAMLLALGIHIYC